MLTNDMVSFNQLGPDFVSWKDNNTAYVLVSIFCAFIINSESW